MAQVAVSPTNQRSDRRERTRGHSTDETDSSEEEVPHQQKRKSRHYAVAMGDFKAVAATELELRAGDIVEVTARPTIEWWFGRRKDDPTRKGYFPAGHLLLQRKPERSPRRNARRKPSRETPAPNHHANRNQFQNEFSSVESLRMRRVEYPHSARRSRHHTPNKQSPPPGSSPSMQRSARSTDALTRADRQAESRAETRRQRGSTGGVKGFFDPP